MREHREHRKRNGFTLIELSIVLVIIGLIVGGIMTGQTLIAAAAARAQITQIEGFQTATTTFKGKYNALPGDMNAVTAAQFSFAPRGQGAGEGDGNGIIEGNFTDSSGPSGCCWGGAAVVGGETVMFWSDLTYANGQNVNLIEGSFTGVGGCCTYGWWGPLSLRFPTAKIGRKSYVYVWSGGPVSGGFPASGVNSNGTNYFEVSSINDTNAYSGFGGSYNLYPAASPGFTVQEAYAIDKKIDDGFPQSGHVTATYLTVNGVTWAAGGGAAGASSNNSPTTTATPGSSTTCYDNGDVAGATQQYSVEINNGTNLNCALSFQMQVGD